MSTDLIQAHVSALVAGHVGYGEDAFRAIATLQLLLQHFPGDMDSASRDILCAGLIKIINKLSSMR